MTQIKIKLSPREIIIKRAKVFIGSDAYREYMGLMIWNKFVIYELVSRSQFTQTLVTIIAIDHTHQKNYRIFKSVHALFIFSNI